MTDSMQSEVFVQFVASGAQRGRDARWKKVTVRPVEIRHERHLQFIYLDDRKDIRRNFSTEGAWRDALREVFDGGFANFHLQSDAGDIHVRIGKRGRPLVSRGRPSTKLEQARLAHNRARASLLPPAVAEPYLRAVGIADESGDVKPTMRAKYRQVEAFLRLIDQKLPSACPGGMRVVDCGCGSAYLTLAVYAMLTQVKGWQTSIVGVDRERDRVEKCRALAGELGWDDVRFIESTIGEFVPEAQPDMVLALHACDTATDEALARGVRWEAGLLFAAPCCQQELSGQIDADDHNALLRHGILKQRTADLLTDALRAAALEAAGYRTDVVEFVTSDVTSKNLLIRAERKGSRPRSEAVEQYRVLRDCWRADPSIGRLLGGDFVD